MERTLTITFALGIIIFTSACDAIFPPLSTEQVEQTKKICREISVPESFKKIRSSAFEKRNAVTYSTEFYSDEDPKSIEKFFAKNLTSEGWTFSPNYQGTTYLRFQKNEYHISIEFQDFSFTTDKHFGLTCSCGLY